METFLNICFQNALSKDVKKKSSYILSHCLKITFLLEEQMRCFVSGVKQIVNSHVSPQKRSASVGACFFTKETYTWASFPGSAAAWSHTQDPCAPPHPHPCPSLNQVSLKSSMQRSFLSSNNINHKHYIIEKTLEGSVSFLAGLSHSKGTQWTTKGKSGFRCGLI